MSNLHLNCEQHGIWIMLIIWGSIQKKGKCECSSAFPDKSITLCAVNLFQLFHKKVTQTPKKCIFVYSVEKQAELVGLGPQCVAVGVVIVLHIVWVCLSLFTQHHKPGYDWSLLCWVESQHNNLEHCFSSSSAAVFVVRSSGPVVTSPCLPATKHWPSHLKAFV